MKKIYGSLNNRIEEGRNYTGREIRVGDDVTEYLWSDRHPYYVTEVTNQKHIKIHPYAVCADRSKEGGMGHQNWKYFKTIKEHNEYLNSFHLALNGEEIRYNVEDVKENSDIELVFRYGNWYEVVREQWGVKLEKPRYIKMNPLSFGVRDYYYDWEF